MSWDIVALDRVTKRFSRTVANDGISLSVRKGEIFALLGENGAGKSTLVSLLFGLYEPDEGRIFIRGKETKIRSPRQASALGIGMVHQHFKLVLDMSVAENIMLGREPVKRKLGFLSPVDAKGAKRKIRELCKDYGLDVDPDAKIGDLPVALRQRVEILKMLYRDAEILIFDEPTAVLAPQEIDSLLDVLKALRDGGKTIILISHKLDEIKKVASRCAILCRGKLAGVYGVDALSAREMASLMVGHDFQENENSRCYAGGPPVLELDGICLSSRHGAKIVDNVSLCVHAGEIVAVAGVAGNGQVELADIAAGLLAPSSGAIRFKSQDITRASTRERMRMGIAYIPEDRQETGLLLDLDLAANLALKSYFHAPFCKRGVLNPQAFRENGKRLLEQHDIRAAEGVQTIVRSMSGGNQQKSIVAREISLDAALYVFVQPTRGLDVGAINSMQQKILELADRDKAILLISLELDEIMKLADTVAVMYNGRIQALRQRGALSASEIGAYMTGAAHEA